jgi:hypothetical protein
MTNSDSFSSLGQSVRVCVLTRQRILIRLAQRLNKMTDTRKTVVSNVGDFQTLERLQDLGERYHGDSNSRSSFFPSFKTGGTIRGDDISYIHKQALSQKAI